MSVFYPLVQKALFMCQVDREAYQIRMPQRLVDLTFCSTKHEM